MEDVELETNIVITDENREEMELLYGKMPEVIQNTPETHDISEAIEGSIEEDKEVIINEISE